MKSILRIITAALAASAIFPTLTAATEPGILRELKNLDAQRMNLNDVADNGSGRMIAVGDVGTIRVSDDHGGTWTTKDSNVACNLEAVGWTGSHWIAVGGISYESCTILKSVDGEDWTTTCLLGKPALLGVAAKPTTTVAVGENILTAHSTDLVAWNGSINGSYDFADVVWTGVRFVAVGDHGLVRTSSDGVTWTPRTSGTSDQLNAVAWFKPLGLGTPLAIAAGFNGTILTSTDTTTWGPQTSGTTEHINDIVVGTVLVKPSETKRIIAVGDNGTILYSGNGISWNTVGDSGTSSSLLGVAARNFGFVAVGGGGTILTSPNGIDWTTQTSGTSKTLYDVTWTGSQLVATGTGGVVLTSPDGIQWTRRYRSGATALFAVAALDSGRLAAVGTFGTIAISDPSMDFTDWIAAESAPSGQDGPDDDPNGDRITNLLAYGLGIPAVAPTGPADFAALPRLLLPGPGRPMIIQMGVANAPLGDIAYIAETSTTLEPGSWTEVLRHMPGQSCGTGSAQIIMSGASTQVFIVFPESIGDQDRYFARLRVEQTP